MKVTCDYCGNQYEDSAKNCPSCGAPNNFVRSANGEPQTIEELKKWYKDHNLPPENVTRYFIGKDIKEPKAFGIYYDGRDYVVYKNKLDGTRAIRYQGSDERYAVNELYQRLKIDIVNQKSNQRFNGAGYSSSTPVNNRSNASNSWKAPQSNRRSSNQNNIVKIIIAIVIIYFIISILSGLFVGLSGSTSSYRSTPSYSYSSDYSDNSSSDWDWDWGSSYDDDSDWGSDWDSDSSWDSFDSWDSGSSDWGSDW